MTPAIALIILVAFLVGLFAGLAIGVLFYVAGIKRGIQLASHDALVVAGVINDPIASKDLEPFVREAVEKARKPKPVDVRAEWEEEKRRLHDAGIY